MIINKSSWHYETLTEDFFFVEGWNPSRSLCLYFWQVMFRLGMGVGICMMATSPLVFLMVEASGYLPETFGVVVALWGLMGCVILILCGIAFILLFLAGVMYLLKKLKSRYFPKKDDTPTESLIVSYIKAKKNKICPMLEFKESGE